MVTTRAYIVIFLRIVGALFSLLAQLLVTRMLDIDSAGVFFLGINCLLLASSFSKLGMDQVLVRESAGAIVHDRTKSAFDIVKVVSSRVTVAGLIITILTILAAFILLWFNILPSLTLTTTMTLLLATLPISLLAIWSEFARVADDMWKCERHKHLEEKGSAVTSYVEELCKEMGAEAEVRIEEGHPASVILDVAEKENVDLLVIGTLGKTADGRFRLGSVAEKVIRNSPAELLVVR